MSDIRPQVVIDKIITLLDSNITDLNSDRRRQGKNWIFGGFPRLDAQMPRIGISLITAPLQSGGVNNEKIEICRIQITIVLKANAKYDYNNDGVVENAEDTIDYLANEVVKTIKNNNDWFKTQLGDNLIHVTPLGQPRTNRNAGFTFRYVEVEAKYEKV